MEEYIERSVDEFYKTCDLESLEKIKIENEDYYYHLTDVMSERWQEITVAYPHNFRASFLTQIYSGIESELRKICEHYHRKEKTSKSADELKAKNDIARYAKFLKTQAGVNFNALKDDWAYIGFIRKIRNLIIHHQCKITGGSPDWQQIKKFILSNPDMIEFKEDLDEKDEDGNFYYNSRPKYGFSFIINSKKLNQQFLERFFTQLLVHQLKYT